MSIIPNHRAYEIAGRLGSLLEGEETLHVGAALGMVLAQFILLLDRTDEGISEGIDAIAGDAKDAAMKIRNMRQ